MLRYAQHDIKCRRFFALLSMTAGSGNRIPQKNIHPETSFFRLPFPLFPHEGERGETQTFLTPGVNMIGDCAMGRSRTSACWEIFAARRISE